MKHVSMILALIAAVSFGSPALATVVETIEGSFVGDGVLAGLNGPVTGTVEYDDSVIPFLGPNFGDVYIADVFTLDLTSIGGPIFSTGNLPFSAVELVPAEIEVDAVTGDLLGLTWLFSDFSGFGAAYGSTDLAWDSVFDFAGDFVAPSFFVSDDFTGAIYGEGAISFVRDPVVPVPATVLLLGLGAGLLGLRRRR